MIYRCGTIRLMLLAPLIRSGFRSLAGFGTRHDDGGGRGGVAGAARGAHVEAWEGLRQAVLAARVRPSPACAPARTGPRGRGRRWGERRGWRRRRPERQSG
jgi:hypothetical protein